MLVAATRVGPPLYRPRLVKPRATPSLQMQLDAFPPLAVASATFICWLATRHLRPPSGTSRRMLRRGAGWWSWFEGAFWLLRPQEYEGLVRSGPPSSSIWEKFLCGSISIVHSD